MYTYIDEYNIYSSYLHTHLLKVGRHNNKSQILKVGIGIMKNDQFCLREYLNIYTICDFMGKKLDLN